MEQNSIVLAHGRQWARRSGLARGKITPGELVWVAAQVADVLGVGLGVGWGVEWGMELGSESGVLMGMGDR
jgi:hypothetical protein